ncbi:MAG: hypothetical protein IPK97_12485 [Ahniella sp.]|nr:hypothetical protein [Ahniella sp.]
MFVRIRTILLIATLLLSGPLSAAILVVNTFNSDAGDTNIMLAGCDSNPGLPGDQCTLRAAIMQANATATLDQIVLPVSTEIVLNNAGLGDLGDLDITEDVVIGVLAIPNDVTTLPRIRATFADRIFDVSNNAQVTFQGMIIEDGDAGAGNGGAIRAAIGSIVDIDRVRFVDNRAQSGGAIHNAGLMSIEGSDFTLNRCVEGGSAVMNTGVLTFSTSSIRNIRDDPSLGQADAIRTADNSTLNVLNSTIDGSRPLIGGTDTGGITAITPASLRVRNSTLTDFSDYALFVSVSPGDDVVIANNILDDSDLFDCQISLFGGATVDQARVGWNQISSSNCGASLSTATSVTHRSWEHSKLPKHRARSPISIRPRSPRPALMRAPRNRHRSNRR